MPIPKPKPSESNQAFINRCMNDEVMNSEFPNENQRYAVCNSQIDKNYLTNKQRKIISNNFVRNIKVSEKKNYSIAYNFYMSEFNKGIEFFKEEQSPSNQNINTLFKEKMVKNLIGDIWANTGIKFYNWYNNYFGNQKKNISIKEITNNFINKKVQETITSEETNVINQNIRGYVNGRENYLAIGDKITGVSGVARETLRKILRKYIYDKEFMALGEDAKVRVLSKELKFKSRWMAKRVVRTETTAAANFGIQLSAKDLLGDDGYVKGWIATDDGRTRATHTRAWRQYRKTPIDVNDLFIVGGSYLKFPGDYSHGAVAAETINCRCVSVPFNKDLFTVPGNGLSR